MFSQGHQQICRQEATTSLSEAFNLYIQILILSRLSLLDGECNNRLFICISSCTQSSLLALPSPILHNYSPSYTPLPLLPTTQILVHPINLVLS